MKSEKNSTRRKKERKIDDGMDDCLKLSQNNRDHSIGKQKPYRIHSYAYGTIRHTGDLIYLGQDSRFC